MLSTQGVTHLSFDLDDTLWDNGPVLAKAELKMLQWLHKHCPKTQPLLNQDNLSAWKQESFSHQPDGYDISQLRRDALARLLLPLGYSDAHVAQAFEVFYQQRQQVALFPGALETLKQLSQRYQLISITNGNVDASKLAIDAYFSQHFSAAQLGVKKPSPMIYQRVAKKLAIASCAIVHIGDSYRLDVAPAIEAGWQAIWFNPQAKPAPVPVCQISSLRQLSEWLL